MTQTPNPAKTFPTQKRPGALIDGTGRVAGGMGVDGVVLPLGNELCQLCQLVVRNAGSSTAGLAHSQRMYMYIVQVNKACQSARKRFEKALTMRRDTAIPRSHSFLPCRDFPWLAFSLEQGKEP
jgi:hypothetical protein